MDQEKSCIAHVISSYLPLTCSWIYNQLIYLKLFKPIVLTERTFNLDKFPFDEIYSLSEWPAANRFFQRSYKAITGTYLPYYRSIIRKKCALLMHVHFGDIGYLNLKLKKDLGLPQITSFYGYDASAMAKSPASKYMFKALFDTGELFLVEGNHMKSRLIDLGCAPEKICVQHLGVDLDKIDFLERAPGEHGKIRLLVAATFKEKKGIIYAVEAFARINKKYKNLELLIVGDIENKRDSRVKRQILKCIGKNNLSGSIKLLGYLPHPSFLELSRRCHIFLAPSIHADNGDAEGGLPVSIIEMSASGMPIVSTRHCDIPEAVINDKNGFLVPEKDVEMLADRLEFLINHPRIWKDMGRFGRKHIEMNYNIRTQARLLEDIYKKLLSR